MAIDNFKRPDGKIPVKMQNTHIYGTRSGCVDLRSQGVDDQGPDVWI